MRNLQLSVNLWHKMTLMRAIAFGGLANILMIFRELLFMEIGNNGDGNMFSWTSAALTDVGKRRKVNEDAYLERPNAGIWVVADGMGGYEAGDIASQAIIECLKTISIPAKMSAFVNDVEERLLTVVPIVIVLVSLSSYRKIIVK